MPRLESDYTRAREYLEELVDRLGRPVTLEEFKRLFSDNLFRAMGEEWIKDGLIKVEVRRPRRRRFKVRRLSHVYTIFRTIPDAEYVRLVKGKKERVVRSYTKDRRGQFHRIGKDGKFQHFSKLDRQRLRLSRRVDKRSASRSPSGVKKEAGKEGGA